MTVSVLMPTYGQAAFIVRAIESLLAQRYSNWQLIIVDDGSRDDTQAQLTPYRDDPRITVHVNAQNEGLGAALNRALDLSDGELVAYLPSDDVWYSDHLSSLVEALHASDAVMASSGIRYRYNKTSETTAPDFPLQLCQVLHRRTEDRWMERSELTTDDLDRMLWDKLRARGPAVSTGLISCEWVDHPHQRHKILREPLGGINPYRSHYRVQQPMRFHTTTGHLVDEVGRYARFRDRELPPRADGLKILLVGELAYNPERVIALAEAGHKLYGLWTDTPCWFNWVGPQPFGHVEEIPRDDWQNAVRRIRPDVIYGLLNWQAVPFAHHVLTNNPGIPFVWHFKEGPFICLEKGMWQQLVDLHTRSDGSIYSSEEMRDWFATVAPETVNGQPSLILDGDLPKRDWFGAPRSRKLSADDGEIHTVVPGRPIGLHAEMVGELASHGIHLHFYGEITHGAWASWIERAKGFAGRFFHLHPNVDQENWVAEFSKYDAGWLHSFQSRNFGELRRADWDDLNLPARIGTLMVSGLPMIQFDNSGHRVATHRLALQQGLGISYRTFEDLAEQLRSPKLQAIADNVWARREEFMFDHHVPALTAFFRQVASNGQTLRAA